MRKLIYWLLLPLAVAVSACGGKKGTSDNQSLLARIDSIDAHGLPCSLFLISKEWSRFA